MSRSLLLQLPPSRLSTSSSLAGRNNHPVRHLIMLGTFVSTDTPSQFSRGLLPYCQSGPFCQQDGYWVKWRR